MPKKIILIRHGETDHNKERRIQGWLDVPLNETGHSQAQAVARLLAKYKLDALYSSDLKRAHQTAHHISTTTKLAIHTTVALRERDMGIFSGWAWESEPDPVKESLWQEFLKSQEHSLRDWKRHQGESLLEMATRVNQFLSQLSTSHQGQSVGLVSHGGTINRILEYFSLKQTTESFRMIRNASILVLHKKTDSYIIEETES